MDNLIMEFVGDYTNEKGETTLNAHAISCEGELIQVGTEEDCRHTMQDLGLGVVVEFLGDYVSAMGVHHQNVWGLVLDGRTVQIGTKIELDVQANRFKALREIV